MKKNMNVKRFSIFLVLFLLLIYTVGCGSRSCRKSPKNTETTASFETRETDTTSAPEDTTADFQVLTTEEETEKQTDPSSIEETTEQPTDDTEKETTSEEIITDNAEDEISVEEDGEYSDKEHVALYIHTFGHLPDNYITKAEAEKLGWVSSKGDLWKVAYGKSVGGSRFGNYEGSLPKKKGRKYYECDIDFDGKYRNAKRIIYSDDGLIYYTGDHYKTFEQLYGEGS